MMLQFHQGTAISSIHHHLGIEKISPPFVLPIFVSTNIEYQSFGFIGARSSGTKAVISTLSPGLRHMRLPEEIFAERNSLLLVSALFAPT